MEQTLHVVILRYFRRGNVHSERINSLAVLSFDNHSILSLPDLLFPALDILRLAIRWPAVNKHFCSQSDGGSFLDFISSHLLPDTPEKALPTNQMMSLRVLCNAFSQPEGLKLLTQPEQYQRIVGATVMVCGEGQVGAGNKNVQVAAATVLMNYAAAAHSGYIPLEDKVQCLSAVASLAEISGDVEVSFRLLVAMGTLLHSDKAAVDLAKSMNIEVFLNKCLITKEPEKIPACAQLILSLVR